MNLIVWLVLLGLITAIMMSSILSVLDSSSGRDNDYNLKRRRLFRNPSEWPEMGDNFQNLFWVVQLTDLHISIHEDFSRSSDLLRFCSEYLSIIDPEVVIVTGDLTHAKGPKGHQSYQIEEEWKTYSKVTHQCQKLTRAKWFDIRGNHDDFDVLNYDSKNNFFKSHSIMETPLLDMVGNNSGFHHRLHLPFGTYSFIGIDAALKPGPKIPFNFFGTLDDREIVHIKKMEAESRHSNQTVWFGHFPTSLIVHDPAILRNIMSNGIAYLCGHLHRMGDLLPQLYSKQKSGILELELGDWKYNRMFRVIAFDHDIMSLTDEFLGNWPVILITNPKDSQFYSKENEPMEMVKYSTHIRVLIFNPTPIVSAVITIDNFVIGEAEQVKGPLYACEWNPLNYGQGLHKIEITVRDETGIEKMASHSFSIDGTSKPFNLLCRIVLMPNIFSLGKIAFGVMVFLYTLILTSLRQCEHIRNYYIHGLPIIDGIFNSFITKVWRASRTKSSYVILITCILYLTFGPWFVDELLTGHLGVVFVWGIIFPGAFISGGHTYFHGIFQFLSFNLPLPFALGHVLDMRHRHRSNLRGTRYLSTFFPIALLFAFSFIIMMNHYPVTYTLKSIYLGPLRTGNVLIVPLSVYLALRSSRKNKDHVNEVE